MNDKDIIFIHDMIICFCTMMVLIILLIIGISDQHYKNNTEKECIEYINLIKEPN